MSDLERVNYYVISDEDGIVLNQERVPATLTGVEWELRLSQDRSYPLAGGFDVGLKDLPLRLVVASEISIDIGWEAWIRFGFSKQDGFYFRTRAGVQKVLDQTTFNDGTPFNLDTGFADVGIYANMNLKQFLAEGRLFFLDVTANLPKARPSICEEAEFRDSPLCSPLLGADFSICLDPDGKGILSLGDLFGRASSIFRLKAELQANAVLDLEVGTIIEQAPSFRVSALVALSFRKQFGNNKPATFNTTVSFLNPRIVLGRWLTKTVLPILEEVNNALEPIVDPLRPFLKNMPGISVVFGRDVTYLEFFIMMAQSSGGGGGKSKGTAQTVVKLVKAVDEVLQIISDIRSIDGGDNAELPIGGPTWRIEGGGLRELGESCTDIDCKIAVKLRDTPEERRRRRMAMDSQAAKTNRTIQASDLFKIPLLQNPAQAMGIFQGKTVDLIIFTSPKAEFTVSFYRCIPFR